MEPNVDRHQEEKGTYLHRTFYGKGSILLAMLIGGPIAGGILIRRNFIHFEKPNKGTIALVVTSLWTVPLFFIPGDIAEKIPGYLIFIIYNLIVLVWVLRIQGPALDLHKKAGGAFYAIWKAAGHGVLGLCILIIGQFLMFSWPSETYNVDPYFRLTDQIVRSGRAAVTFPKPSTNKQLVIFIKETSIPTWEKNLLNIEKLKEMEASTPEKFSWLKKSMVSGNTSLQKFNEMKLKTHKLLLKSIEENTDKYDQEIKRINDEWEASKDSK